MGTGTPVYVVGQPDIEIPAHVIQRNTVGHAFTWTHNTDKYSWACVYMDTKYRELQLHGRHAFTYIHTYCRVELY